MTENGVGEQIEVFSSKRSDTSILRDSSRLIYCGLTTVSQFYINDIVESVSLCALHNPLFNKWEQWLSTQQTSKTAPALAKQ